MRHRPTSTPAYARLLAGVSRVVARAAGTLRIGRRRLGLGVVVVALVTGFVLAAPVVSGPGAPAGSDAASPVVMGIDGRRTSADFASASARLRMGPDGVRLERSSRSDRTAAPASAAPVPPAATGAPTGAPTEAAPPAAPSSTAVPAPRSTVAEEPVPPSPAPAPAPAAAPPAPAGSDRAGQVLALVNEARASAGCRPLVADAGLASVAAAHSADMRDRGYFDHVDLDGRSPFDRAQAAGLSARAENIARGQADPAAVMTAWLASPGHRANIVDCSLTRLGVGIADGGGGPWWTQLFA